MGSVKIITIVPLAGAGFSVPAGTVIEVSEEEAARAVKAGSANYASTTGTVKYETAQSKNAINKETRVQGNDRPSKRTTKRK